MLAALGIALFVGLIVAVFGRSEQVSQELTKQGDPPDTFGGCLLVGSWLGLLVFCGLGLVAVAGAMGG